MSNRYPPSVTIPVYAVFTAVGIALTALRFWSRISFSKTRTGPDDWLILVGLFFVCACTAIQFYNAIHGTGGAALSEHDAEERAQASHRINFTMIVIEKPGFGAIKLSLLYFYKRIFDIWPSFRRTNMVLIWIIILWTIAFVLADLLLCGFNLAPHFALDQVESGKQCGDKGLLLLMFAITSVMTDLMVLILPFVYVSRLQMPKQKKWAASIIFLLGTISTAAGILRTIFLSISYPMGRMSWGYKAPPHDETPLVLQVFNPTFWVMIEITLGLWAANLPPMAPLAQAMGLRGMVSSVVRKMSVAYGTMSRAEKSTQLSSKSNHAHQRRESDSERPIFDPAYEMGPRSEQGAMSDMGAAKSNTSKQSMF